MELVSVIIPVYNTEKFLRECIGSVLKQDYAEMEVLLVDDGSDDGSGKICDEYAEKDDRVRVFHKSNGGPMSAWLLGLENSRGVYIASVDSDDVIDENMISVLMENAEKSGADITICTLVSEGENGVTEYERLLYEPGFYTRRDITDRIFPTMISSGTWPARGLSPSRVTKLYRKSLLMKNAEFYDPLITLGEDLLTCFVNVMSAESLYIIGSFSPYHYRYNSSSITCSYNHDNYAKIRRLNHDLTEADAKFFDCFSGQIADDYIYLMLQQFELEILYSGKNRATIKSDILSEYNSERFRKALKKADVKKLSKKNKLYLILLGHGMCRLLIYLRLAIHRHKEMKREWTGEQNNKE